MVLITKCFDLVYWRSGFDQYAVKLIIFFSLGDGPLTTSVSIECEANDHSNDQRSITGHCEEDLVADQSAGTSTTFTLEEELLFAQRLEEGHDLVDPKYTEWLKYNVPEHHNSLAVTTQIAVTTHSGSTSHVTADVLAGTTPLGSSLHVTADVAGTTPLGSSSHITTDVVAGTTPLGPSSHITADVAGTTPLGSSSHTTTYVLAGTTPLGSSSHVTTDVLAGTTPLGSSSHVTTDVVACTTPL